MFATPLGRFRAIAIIEGISSLVLFFVAMPIKYVPALGSNPTPVVYTGWVHGILFMLYAAAGFHTLYDRKWGLREAFWGFVAAVIPGGTFVYDRFLRREQEREAAEKATAARDLQQG